MGEWFELEGERIEGGWREGGGGVRMCIQGYERYRVCVCSHTRERESHVTI